MNGEEFLQLKDIWHPLRVMQGLPTENEIRAQANSSCPENDSYTGKIIHKAAFEIGARWAISKLSNTLTDMKKNEQLEQIRKRISQTVKDEVNEVMALVDYAYELGCRVRGSL
jgi:hypothetical protein